MQFRFSTRPLMLAALAAGLAACDNSLTSPGSPDSPDAVTDRTPTTRPQRPDTAKRRCRRDDELTPEQVAAIRALYNAYQDEIADDLRLIAEVQKKAREAAARGATHEQIAEILARADEAKKHVAEATERLRAAIAEILHDDRPPCFVAVGPVSVGGR